MTTPRANLFTSEALPRRKQPRQNRSLATVERIKQAMLDLVTEEGYAAASTNRVASRARVNIASLYQYFPNRQAIALALYESASSELAQRAHEHLLTTLAQPMDQGILKLIRLVVNFLEKKKVALLHLPDEVPDLRASAQFLSLENLARNSSLAYLEHHLGTLDEATLTCKLYFVQNLGMNMIRSYVLNRPTGISRARFVAELSGLIVMYLRQPAVVAENQSRR